MSRYYISHPPPKKVPKHKKLLSTPMAISFRHHFVRTTVLYSVITLLLLLPTTHSLTCTSQKFTTNTHYTHCVDLPVLNSYLHWSLPTTNSNPFIPIVFVSTPPSPSGWVSYAINPTGTGMAGSQALVALKNTGGVMVVKTYNISSYSMIQEGKLSFDVKDLRAEEEGGAFRIFAMVDVARFLNAGGVVNQVWQVGSAVLPGGFPAKHAFAPENLNAKGTLDLGSGVSGGGGGGSGGGMKKKNIHGILNAVSWGIMFPVGAVIARYVRVFPSADPAWFYLHAFCQTSAYAIGVAGWATGLKLGSESKGIQYTTHRDLGIALFTLATVQIFALFVRPKKDHKYRFYWNIYHHGLGYAILTLGIINIFKGFSILHPATKWKTSYITVIAAIGVIALVLEAFTWIIVLRQNSGKPSKPYDGYKNGESREQSLAP